MSYLYHKEGQRVLIINTDYKNPTPCPLFFHEYGYFPIFYFNQENKIKCCMGVPITHNRVLVPFIKEEETEVLLSYISKNKAEHIINSSVGASKGKILVHPDLLNCNEHEQIKKQIISLRNNNMQLRDNANELYKYVEN